jgi:hypothetical protein
VVLRKWQCLVLKGAENLYPHADSKHRKTLLWPKRSDVLAESFFFFFFVNKLQHYLWVIIWDGNAKNRRFAIQRLSPLPWRRAETALAPSSCLNLAEMDVSGLIYYLVYDILLGMWYNRLFRTLARFISTFNNERYSMEKGKHVRQMDVL